MSTAVGDARTTARNNHAPTPSPLCALTHYSTKNNRGATKIPLIEETNCCDDGSCSRCPATVVVQSTHRWERHMIMRYEVCICIPNERGKSVHWL